MAEKTETPVDVTKPADKSAKLSKKERKALEFKQKAKGIEVEDLKRKRDEEQPETEDSTDGTEKKKRKTRRGKKGKGTNSGPRFLLFAGNLPYNVTEEELKAHFAGAKPDRVRIRTDKGIAFLELDTDGGAIQNRMDVALRLHHSLLRGRKINVELTVGGGGNSSNRLEKIKEKNGKLEDERRDRMLKERRERRKKLAAEQPELTNVHPDRANLIRK